MLGIIFHPSPTTGKFRSSCCGADVQISRRITCSGPCHEELVRRLIDEFGEYKVVVNAEGVKHLVPTRYIIERGLRHDEILASKRPSPTSRTRTSQGLRHLADIAPGSAILSS